MRWIPALLCLALFACDDDDAAGGPAPPDEPPVYQAFVDDPSSQLTALDLRYDAQTDAVIFEVTTAGDAASWVPQPAGQVDGAPVVGYVFTTTLQAEDVGFPAADGVVALAITSHPDFDDTPLWDEDGNAAYDDDGAIYHAHWVLLEPNERAPAGLAAKQAGPDIALPPTAPMPMYLDSPGFTVVEDGSRLRVLVPADRMRRRLDLQASALTAWMQVDASGETPLLAVHHVASQWQDGAQVAITAAADAAAPWPAQRAPMESDPSFDIEGATVTYRPEIDSLIFSMQVAADAASAAPTPAGQVDGAPVLGYVFPTTIPPEAVGFRGVEGTLVLAVTSHPDFDDTPLWDESLDGDYANDGAVYHVHWAVLVEDPDSPAGLSVPSQPLASLRPPTSPMPMYLDSPGFHAFARDRSVHVVVPAWHLRGVSAFNFDAVTARMRVDASGDGPVLRVEEVFEVLSGDLSLPQTISWE